MASKSILARTAYRRRTLCELERWSPDILAARARWSSPGIPRLSSTTTPPIRARRQFQQLASRPHPPLLQRNEPGAARDQRKLPLGDPDPSPFEGSSDSPPSNRLQSYSSRIRSTKIRLDYRDAIFVSIDCEAVGDDGNKITEIGIALLDTRDLVHTEPGAGAVNWMTMIQSYHAIIRDYRHLIKTGFSSRPENFMFGETDIIPLSSAAEWTRSFFRHYDSEMKLRDTVLVGHALMNERKFCKTFGLELDKSPSVVDEFDTASILFASKRMLGLARLLEWLDIPTKFMHNAGNDATYTLQALIALAAYSPEQQTQLDQRQKMFFLMSKTAGALRNGNVLISKAQACLVGGTTSGSNLEDSDQAREPNKEELMRDKVDLYQENKLHRDIPRNEVVLVREEEVVLKEVPKRKILTSNPVYRPLGASKSFRQVMSLSDQARELNKEEPAVRASTSFRPVMSSENHVWTTPH